MRTHQSLGFTLVELLVVLAVLGLAAAVVVPALATRARADAASVAHALEIAYGEARDEAVDHGVPVRVAVELGTGRYLVLAAAPGAPVPARGGAVALGAGVRLTGGDGAWAVTTFDPFGRARGDRVHIADRERAYDLSADAWTAAVDAQRR